MYCLHCSVFCSQSTDLLYLHSFPTRRSSDLTFLFGVIILIANILKRAFSSQLADIRDEIGRAVQQECRDRARMASSAWKKNSDDLYWSGRKVGCRINGVGRLLIDQALKSSSA